MTTGTRGNVPATTAPFDPAVLLRLGSATLYEASKLDCFLPPRIRPVWQGAAVVGCALPVSTAPADNLPLHIALKEAEPGEVLVVDGHRTACGYWGEVLTAAAQARGVAGLVIDGGVRDTHALRERGFPVFSSSVAVRTTVKDDAGTVGTPVAFDGVTVHRGDVVVADADGVIVLPRDRVAAVVERGLARESAEAGYLRRIADGELTLDIYGFLSTAGD